MSEARCVVTSAGTHACRDGVHLIRLDPILLKPLTTNSNQRALGDELRWAGLRRPPAILVHADQATP